MAKGFVGSLRAAFDGVVDFGARALKVPDHYRRGQEGGTAFQIFRDVRFKANPRALAFMRVDSSEGLANNAAGDQALTVRFGFDAHHLLSKDWRDHAKAPTQFRDEFDGFVCSLGETIDPENGGSRNATHSAGIRRSDADVSYVEYQGLSYLEALSILRQADVLRYGDLDHLNDLGDLLEFRGDNAQSQRGYQGVHYDG